MFQRWVGALVGLAMMGLAGSANATLITWQNETFTGVSGVSNSDNFDTGFITFTPFVSDSLDDISSAGFYHIHGTTAILFFIDIFLDGAWNTIFTDTLTVAANVPNIDIIGTPISFTQGLVSGIRLRASGAVNQAWHLTLGTTTPTVFDFNMDIPEPSSILLFSVGLAGLALIRRRRNRRRQN